MNTMSSKSILPPIQPDINFVNRGREVERMLAEARQTIAQSVQRLVEHAGRVQGQVDSELGSFRTVGQAYMKLSKESHELHDRCVTNESSLDQTSRELAAQNKVVLELNARISELQRELSDEKHSRMALQQQLDDAHRSHQTEARSLREQIQVDAAQSTASHKAEVDELHQTHTSEKLKQENAFRMLEQRLDNVAQSHLKQTATAKSETQKLQTEVEVLRPRAAALAQTVQDKDEEIKKLFNALQKAHSVGENAKKDLLSEQNELATLKETLRKSLEVTAKTQTDLKAKTEEAEILAGNLSRMQADFERTKGGLTEEQEEVVRLREAFKIAQGEAHEAENKIQELDDQHKTVLAEQQDKLQTTEESYKLQLEERDAENQRLNQQIEDLGVNLEATHAELARMVAAAEAAARQPKKRLSLTVNNGQPVFSKQLASPDATSQYA